MSEVLQNNLYSKHLKINFTYDTTTTKRINSFPKYKSGRSTKAKQHDYYMTPRSKDGNHETDDFGEYYSGKFIRQDQYLMVEANKL